MASSALIFFGVLIAIAAVSSAAFIQDPNNVQIGYHPAVLPMAAATTSPSTKLELEFSLNATSIQAGQAVNISLSEYNPLPIYNNVSSSDAWAVEGLSDGPCGTLNNPMGYEVFTGYYTSSNVSSAKSLELYEPGLYSCPAMYSVSAYGFHPQSSVADFYASCSPMLCFTDPISATSVVRGYWTSGSANPIDGGTFHAFAPGVYTVVGGDEWGTTTFLYFVVH